MWCVSVATPCVLWGGVRWRTTPKGERRLGELIMVRLTTRQAWWVYAGVMESGESFSTSGALRGGSGGSVTFGQLPGEYRDAVAGADYVVFSYETPIAWRNCDGSWTVPDVKYSRTTSGHQSKIRAAVGSLG